MKDLQILNPRRQSADVHSELSRAVPVAMPSASRFSQETAPEKFREETGFGLAIEGDACTRLS